MISFLGRAKYPLAAAILFCLLIAVFFLWNRRPGEGDSYPKSFDGSSEDLKQTVIVPTLDTPFPEGKSAIWCASFQIAWNKLRSKVVRAPILLGQAEEITDRLNRAEQSEQDLESEMFYSEAGWVNDGIVEKIQKEMAQKFPEVPKPEFPYARADSAVAYGYLKAEVNFQTPYIPNKKPLDFEEKEKSPTQVKSFGIPEPLKGDKKIRDQIEVLFCEFLREPMSPDYFAFDLCKYSSPNQLVIARLPRKGTLAEFLEDLGHRAKKKPQEGQEGYDHTFYHHDSLLVPNMHWRIKHRFKELERSEKPPENPSLQNFWLSEAYQMIEFKLEKSGVKVSSEARLTDKGGPRPFHFNRPFLIYMKKRDAQHPFFVMWVDNAELLIKN
jgi:hypothetical protein